MKIIIDISEETYKEIIDDAEHSPRNLSHYEWIIAKGTPLDNIKSEIEKQEKWLLQAGYSAYNVDIALDAIKYKVCCPMCENKICVKGTVSCEAEQWAKRQQGDAISKYLYEQIRWERDVAIKQLADLGYELGEKIRECEDAISRQAAIRLAEQGQVQGFEWQFKELVKLPSVSTEKTGRWILTDKEEEIYCRVAVCSVCGKESINEGTDDYCSYCGAKMGVEE